MELTREAMVAEAVKRMKILKMMEQPIKEFKEEGVLNLSEAGGLLYWLDDKQKKIVADFEEEFGGLVYHVIRSMTNFGEMLSLMYVSKYTEEWELDIEDLKEGMCVAYVVNVTMPDCSEAGTIGVQPSIGGVRRTW